MRVLVVGKRGGILHWLENVMDAFSDLPGVEAKSFCVNHTGFLEKFWKNIVKTYNRRLLDRIIAAQFDREFERYNPDLILIVDCFYIPDELFEVLAVRKKTSLVAWWIGDLFDRALVTRHNCVDKFYFTDSYFMDYAAEGGIFNTGYLPLAYNPKIFKSNHQGTRKSSLAFVGAYSENRAELLNQIRESVVVVGKKWNRMSATQHEIHPSRVSIERVAEIYSQHIGVLNIKNSGNVVNGLNMRTFDAPACGCVVINDHLKDVERCFEIGKEILVYENVEQLNEQYHRIRRYEDYRIKISKAGNRRVVAEHQYSHRIRSIIEDICR